MSANPPMVNPGPEPAELPARARRKGVVGDGKPARRSLRQQRELLWELTRRDLRIRYTQAVMGVIWAILTPLLVALAGWLLRVGISYMSGVPLVSTELAEIAVKAVAWSFFAGALSFATGSITAHYPLVTKVQFPRQVLPLSAILTQVIDSVIGVAALVVLLPILGVTPSVAWLWLPVLVLLLLAFTTACGLLASCANVFFRDTRHVVQLVVSFGIFFTPVFFNADAFGPKNAGFLMLNPLGPILEGLRLVIVQDHSLLVPLAGARGIPVWEPWYLGWSALWGLGGLLIATLIFRRLESTFSEYV